MLANYIRFFLENKVVAGLLLIVFVAWGLATAPFDFGLDFLPRDPVAVDAIPDIGENQQIVFTPWPGRSPQDVEDQITYPLTTALLGIPGVKSIRSNSMFGFSSIYVIFDEGVAFYWSRSRILEKLNALPANTLPEGVQPTLGPDATALGQIYWYTLEGRDDEGNPTGGWDLHELRSIQDFYVRYGLSAAEGVSEVASIGGFVKEYQVDVDPEAMRAYGVTLPEVMEALRQSNIDVGAQTLEINRAEYFVRGLGYVKNVEDIGHSVIKAVKNVPVRIEDVARVHLGPATRRGVLDKSGAEAVGGVVVARYGANPLQVIENVKARIAEIEPGLPSKTLADGTRSQVEIVPFYDRTELINETIGTLEEALSLEILITILVVILMLLNLRSSLLVAGTLPVAVLMCFIAMRYFGVDANIVALSGIAIAIGTMVDMGIVLVESMVNRLEEAPPGESLLTSIYEATLEVGSAVITAVATTVISFLPVFTMEAAEGKLFRPLAFTKTFALIASIIVAITLIPPLAHSLFSLRRNRSWVAIAANGLAIAGGIFLAIAYRPFWGLILVVLGLTGLANQWARRYASGRYAKPVSWAVNILYALIVAWLLATLWMPLGVAQSNLQNFLFVGLLAGTLIAFFYVVIYFYTSILRFFLRVKVLFLVVVGLLIWQGYLVFQRTGEEFMPALDEGSFLLMPTSMPHSGMEENIRNLRLLDMAVTAIPEVESVVGKAGRVNSALDPAPMSMYENVILYKSEYKTDAQGRRIRYRYEDGEYQRNAAGDLIPDPQGRYYRQWRDEIQSPDDIWEEIVRVTRLPGVTSAPKLQPIETRLVMLQTGMRAPMGIKVQGSDLKTIEAFGLELEKHLKEVEGVKEPAVFAERIIGKPYLLMDIDREAIGRHGLTIQEVQQHIQAAVGGMTMSTSVEGRERYAIRLRYPRELRNDPDRLTRIYLPTANGRQIPLGDLATIRYEQGPQSIKSEDGFLIGYVLFDREEGYSEVEVVTNAQNYLQEQIEQGVLELPASISYRFAGNYEQQVRANQRLRIVLPIALGLIFLILYFQFRSVMVSALVFTGVLIAFAGGFIMIGLYDTPWFLDFELFGTHMRDLFQIRTVNLSVAVWVGFLALFGIATDDGVLVATFLRDSFRKNEPDSIKGIREAVVEGGLRRVRPAMMTTATTILALLPVLTSTGKGADIMLPMAIPSFGGMTLQVITMFTVPVLYALWKETAWRIRNGKNGKTMKIFSLILILGLILPFRAQSQSLEELIQTALNNNPELKAMDTEYRAALEKVPQVGELPDPEVGIGLFPLPVQTRFGPQAFRLSASQMIPWFGVLESREDLEYAKAAAKYKRLAIAELDLRYAVKANFLRLYELERSQAILEENLRLLRTLERLALANLESSKGTSSEVLRVQLQIKEVEQELRILDNQKRYPRSELNQVLNRPADTPVRITADSLGLAVLPFLQDTLLDYLQDKHPGLEALALQQEVSRQALVVNDRNAQPRLGVGLDYITVQQREDVELPRNGRDIVQLKATVQIPLFRKKYAAKAREEELNIQALEERKAVLLNRYAAGLEQAFAAHREASLQAELYTEQIRLLRSLILNLETRYSTGGGRFAELLDLEKDLLNYQQKMLRAIVQSHLAKAGIEKYIIF